MKKKLMFILAILFIASSVFAMKVYLTNSAGSGQAQANPDASLGGYRSTTELSAASMNNLFDNVSIWEALLGDVEYRMIDIYNDGATDALRVQFYMRTPTSSPKTELNFGYSATAQPHADAWNGEALADESTAPASPAMTFANYTKTAPVALGTIAAGKSARICVKRTVTAGAGGWTAQDLGSFGLRWGAAAAAAAPTPFMQELFEDMANDEEWDLDGNWADYGTVPADVYEGDTDVANIPQGSVCGMTDTLHATHEPDLSNGDRVISHTFTELTTGYANFEFYVNWDNVNSSTPTTQLYLVDGTALAVGIRPYSGSILQTNDGAAGWVTVCAIAAATWYKIEIRVDMDDADGLNCVWIYVGGTEYGPFDTYATSGAPTGIDRVWINAWTANRYSYFDAFRFYAGDRYTGSW